MGGDYRPVWNMKTLFIARKHLYLCLHVVTLVVISSVDELGRVHIV